jgi:hypothetical protein
MTWTTLMRRAVEGEHVTGAELLALRGYETRPLLVAVDESRRAADVCDLWYHAAKLAARVDDQFSEDQWVAVASGLWSAIRASLQEGVQLPLAQRALAWELGSAADLAVGLGLPGVACEAQAALIDR